MGRGARPGPAEEPPGQRRRHATPTLPALRQSASTPALPSAKKAHPASSCPPLPHPGLISSKKWTSEHKRLLHEHRERAWLQKKAKHRCVDFSDAERAALRRYFDALAGGRPRIAIDKLEDMLISLGLAETRQEVAGIVDKVDGDGSRELDFEEYMELIRSKADSDIFLVFKAMMEGSLGDQSLNFQTVLSAYRRTLILDATGARGVGSEQRDLGQKILNNFAELQRSRHADAMAAAEAEAAESQAKGESATSAARTTTVTKLPFDNAGISWMGGQLRILWRGVCHDERLVSSRPSSLEGKRHSGRSLQRPMSPTEVVQGIVKARPSLPSLGIRSRCGTVVVGAPAFTEESHCDVFKDCALPE
mmetsp:Transcript_109639/g.338448  ORF Transcript_109639/g.338448 Transcript_109639/m.338448 type:complete len:363 (+) Transcript_109639:121-1209(+)